MDRSRGVLNSAIFVLVRLNAKTGLDTRVYDKEYSTLGAEIERMRERRQKLKDKQAVQVLRVNRIQEIEEYLLAQESPLEKFDEDLFRRVVEKFPECGPVNALKEHVKKLAEETAVLNLNSRNNYNVEC